MKTPITDTQVRAARELLRWDQKKLAHEAGRGIATIRRYETGQQVGEDTTADLVAALERAGVLFIGETSFNGVVVSSAVALRTWARPQARPPTRIYGEPKPAERDGAERPAEAERGKRDRLKIAAPARTADTGDPRPRKRGPESDRSSPMPPGKR